MRKILPIILLIFIPQALLAYEPGLFNLKGAADLESGKGEFKIQHRFFGEAIEDETLDTLFGADSGGNMGLGLRYAVSGIQLSAERLRSRREYILGIGYGHAIPGTPIRGQLDIQYFRYEVFNLDISGVDKENGVFGLLSLQTEPILNRITPMVNLGYDSDEEEFGAGFGLAVIVIELIGTVQKISIIGEYFATSYGDVDRSFTFGIRAETYGHHFDIILGNGSEMSPKRLMAGTIPADTDLRFGFNIKRRFP